MTAKDNKASTTTETAVPTLREMRPAEIVRRCIFLCVGLFIMALGVAFSIKGDLGTSPISSFPYVASLVLPLTVGQATIVLHCILILLQILILRKKYKPVQLLQLPVALVFGELTDLALAIIDGVNPTTHLARWACCIIGILLVAIAVCMEVVSRVTTLAGEGFVLVLSQVLRPKFSTLKICFDVSLVILAVLLSLACLHTVEGVREGTLAAAIFVGLINRRLNPLFEKFEKRFLLRP